MVRPIYLLTFFLLAITHNTIGYSYSNNSNNNRNDEVILRETIFKGYNKYVRPVQHYNSSLDVKIGLAVQNIESFDQIQETMELNVWLRKYWTNSLLTWDTNVYNISQITLTKNDVWTPDIELINAATLPDIYTLNGGMYLYPDGKMIWSIPAVYKFSCSLNLKYFPFDSQICNMKFSSWSFDNTLLNLLPYGELSTQIDVLDTFSHSEWELLDYNIETFNETRPCCKHKLFNVNKYNFTLKRYTHYYILNMGMTISLVIVSFIIMMVSPDNLSRTGTAVFIPLTILALELTIAGKIPVVGYYTLMDIFFLTCFITSMMVSIESGIVYILITSKSSIIYNVFSYIFDLKKVLEKYKDNLKLNKNKKDRHNHEIENINNSIIDRETIQLEDIGPIEDSGTNEDTEFNNVETILQRHGSYHEAIDHNISTKITEVNDTNDINEINDPSENRDKEYMESLVNKNVVRMIDHDNKYLSMTFKEYLIFMEISALSVKIDNICRVLLPLIFFTIIIIIFSYK
jgi:hypothetical protein